MFLHKSRNFKNKQDMHILRFRLSNDDIITNDDITQFDGTYCLQNKKSNFWIAETKNLLRVMRHSADSNSKIEYLRECEFILKTALAHESGDPGVLFAEKNRGSKIS
jgi:hypothetical protein